MARATTDGWLRPALMLVVAVTALRWVLLAFDRTDLFVDESQYWLWGQHLDWGYFSKPPLIGWLIGGVTRLFHSDMPFVVRLPGALLHGVTALLLGAVASRRCDAPTALAATAIYLLAPFAGLGSLLISTDTVMLPLLAGALYFQTRLLGDGHLRWALACGLMIGLACLAKYAGIYALAALILAQILPETRLAWRAMAVIALTTLAVLSPNLIWNATHDFATFGHTASNIGWVQPGATKAHPGLLGSATFLASQFGVFGPLTMGALTLALIGWRQPRLADLAVQALLPLVVVSVQAYLGKAYANWAVASFAAGSVLAASLLVRHRRMLSLAVGLNALVCLALPLLTLWPDLSSGGRPILARYLGRADLSQQILTLAQAGGNLAVVAADRDILADLFYTGRDVPVTIHAQPPTGAPQNYYEQVLSLPPDQGGQVLFVGQSLPAGCTARSALTPLQGRGVWQGKFLAAWQVDAACLAPGD